MAPDVEWNGACPPVQFANVVLAGDTVTERSVVTTLSVATVLPPFGELLARPVRAMAPTTPMTASAAQLVGRRTVISYLGTGPPGVGALDSDSQAEPAAGETADRDDDDHCQRPPRPWRE